MQNRSRALVWATFISAPAKDEVGPGDLFEAGKTYQIRRASLDRWIGLGRARAATPEEIPAQGSGFTIDWAEAPSGHPFKEFTAARSAEPVAHVEPTLPENWRGLSAADLKAAAQHFTTEPVRSRNQAIAVIEAELARREAAPQPDPAPGE